MKKTIAIISAAIVAVLVVFSLPNIAEARKCKCERGGQIEAPFALP